MDITFELNIDNNVWAGIQEIIELLDGDKNVAMFYTKFMYERDDKQYLFEVFGPDMSLAIKIFPFGLVYSISVNGVYAFYKIDFKNENNITGVENLKHYDTLHDKLRDLIKIDRLNIKTRFGFVK